MHKTVAAQANPSLTASNTVSAQAATMPILLSLSFCHLLNDLIQSLIPALYPLLKTEFNLDFAQIGLITLAFQVTASLLQPTVGFYTDKKPQP
jgi:FSR family fosmidomycin resistance protein-like MFS transporter